MSDEMKIQDKAHDDILHMHEKLKAVFGEGEFLMHMFCTLLGAADNISQYVLENEIGRYLELPSRCQYGMLQVYQILTLCSGILHDRIKEVNIGGHFPTGDEAWANEKDFEKRLILLVQLFYKFYKDKGKI